MSPVEAPEAEAGTTTQFDHRRLDIPEREEREGDEALGVCAAPFDLKVIERAYAGQPQVAFELHEGEAEEAEEVGVQDLRLDAMGVHDLQPRRGIPPPGIGFLEAGRRRRIELLPSGMGLILYAEQRVATDVPAISLALCVPLDMRSVVPEPARHPAGPQVGRLGDVRVDIDHRNRFGHALPPPFHTSATVC